MKENKPLSIKVDIYEHGEDFVMETCITKGNGNTPFDVAIQAMLIVANKILSWKELSSKQKYN